jgi:hypothetical protein
LVSTVLAPLYNASKMSVVEDMRKVLQAFLAPELRAVDAKFSAVCARFDAIDEKLDALAKILEARFEATNDRIDDLKTSLDLDKRVERLETRQTH